MGIDPLLRSVLKLVGLAALLSVSSAWLLRSFSDPDPDLMYAIAQVGIAVVFAFVVEAVWMAERVDRSDADHRSWLGTSCGFAILGLSGVALALAVGGHRAAGHANFLDTYGFCWAVFSLLALAALVVLQPLLVDRQRMRSEETPS